MWQLIGIQFIIEICFQTLKTFSLVALNESVVSLLVAVFSTAVASEEPSFKYSPGDFMMACSSFPCYCPGNLSSLPWKFPCYCPGNLSSLPWKLGS